MTTFNAPKSPTSSPVPGGPSAVDATDRVRVSSPEVVFDSQFQYDVMALVWDDKVTGGGAVAHDADGSFAILSTGTTSGDEIIRQSPYSFADLGKSRAIEVSFDFVEQVTNQRKRAGFFDDDNGFFLQELEGVVSIVQRSSVTGSVVDTVVPQTLWNTDKFVGIGRSRKTLDITKSQKLGIDLTWSGVGDARVGFVIDGKFHIAHIFSHANSANKTYMGTANLPVRYELTNTDTAAAAVLRQLGCSIISEGVVSTDIGFEFSAANGATTIAVTTRRPILSIRPKATFNSLVNRVPILLKDAGIISEDVSLFLEIVYNGTLTNASFASVNDDSTVEFDVAATAISGGIVIPPNIYAGVGGVGANTFARDVAIEICARYPLNLDIAGANPKNLTLVATSFGLTTDVAGHFGWDEMR